MVVIFLGFIMVYSPFDFTRELLQGKDVEVRESIPASHHFFSIRVFR
jgi:hypothetical protein